MYKHGGTDVGAVKTTAGDWSPTLREDLKWSRVDDEHRFYAYFTLGHLSVFLNTHIK